jgi:hypothetical protein
VIKLGDGPHLPLKEAGRFFNGVSVRIGSRLFPNDLDRDLPMNASIFCQVDFAHATASDRAQELIVPELCSFERHLVLLLKNPPEIHREGMQSEALYHRKLWKNPPFFKQLPPMMRH